MKFPPRLLAFCLPVLILASAAGEVRATDIVWTNLSGGNWNVAANWSPNQVPGSSDNAFITNSGTYAVTISASASAAVVQSTNGSPVNLTRPEN